MNLHPLPEGEYFCGPAAMAAVTGKDVEKEILPAVRNQRRAVAVAQKKKRKPRDEIKTMYVEEFPSLLRMLGTKCSDVIYTRKDRMTMKQFCALHPDSTYLIRVGHHFVAVSKGMTCCSVQREPIPVAQSRYIRRRVTHVIYIRLEGSDA